MRDKFVLLDQHLRRCGFLDADEAQRLIRQGYAVQHSGRRGVQKRVLRLVRSLAALSGGSPPRLLSPTVFAGTSFIHREMVSTGRGYVPLWQHNTIQQ